MVEKGEIFISFQLLNSCHNFPTFTLITYASNAEPTSENLAYFVSFLKKIKSEKITHYFSLLFTKLHFQLLLWKEICIFAFSATNMLTRGEKWA